jgi:hypothetical protein
MGAVSHYEILFRYFILFKNSVKLFWRGFLQGINAEGIVELNHSPSPGCPVRKHGEEWRKVTAAKPAGRSRVASAQFRLALPRMPRAEGRGASLKDEICLNRHGDSFSPLDARDLPDSRFLHMSSSSFTRLSDVEA